MKIYLYSHPSSCIDGRQLTRDPQPSHQGLASLRDTHFTLSYHINASSAQGHVILTMSRNTIIYWILEKCLKDLLAQGPATSEIHAPSMGRSLPIDRAFLTRVIIVMILVLWILLILWVLLVFGIFILILVFLIRIMLRIILVALTPSGASNCSGHLDARDAFDDSIFLAKKVDLLHGH
jgi:hypothetical protein